MWDIVKKETLSDNATKLLRAELNIFFPIDLEYVRST